MKAVVYHQYGPPNVLQLTTLPKPVPKDNEVLIQVYATTVSAGDVRLRQSDFPPLFWLPARLIFGLFKPKNPVLGNEWSGVVVEVGAKVTRFKVGDEVFGTATMQPGGAYAEYLCLPESWKQGVIGPKPTNLSFQEAAAFPIGGMTALFLWQKAQLQQGQQVLVYGASGSVGSYAVQLAKALGATVTGVCSTANLNMVRDLGADAVVDYTQTDYTQLDTRFEVVFDAVGKTSKSKSKTVLQPQGQFVSVTMMTAETTANLLELKKWAEQGQLRPFIHQNYTLDQVAEAHAYVDSGRKRGNVTITVFEG